MKKSKKSLAKFLFLPALLMAFTACQQKPDTAAQKSAPSISSQQLTTQQLGDLSSKVSTFNEQKKLEWNSYGSPNLDFKFPKDWIVTVATNRKDNPVNFAITSTTGQLKISNENPDPQAKYFTQGYEMDIKILDPKAEIPKNLKVTEFKNIKQNPRNQEYYYFGEKHTFMLSVHSVYNSKIQGTDKMFTDATKGILESLQG